MGMYFNSTETVKMVERVNQHFAAKSDGGRINHWRKKANLFKPTKKLQDAATSEGVIVDPFDDDDDGSHNNNWTTWLTKLHSHPTTPGGTTYVGDVIASYIYGALNDNTIQEIVFSVVPDATNVFVDTPTKIPVGTALYSYSIVIHTVLIANMSIARQRAIKMIERKKLSAAKKKT